MEYIFHLLVMIGIYGIIALSLNLIVGFTGLVSFGHAAFYGIGAYAAAILMKSHGVNFFVAMLVGVLIAGVIALVIGLVMSRFRDHYYTLVSIGLNIIMTVIFFNWESLTNGSLGIVGIPRPTLGTFSFSSTGSFLALVVLALAGTYYLTSWLTTSPFGRVLKAIREDESVISVFGYRTQHFKLFVFVLAAMLAAVAGSLFASYISFIDPYSFLIAESVFMMTIVVFGGLGSLRGSLLGALILVLLPELFRFIGFSADVAGNLRLALYGLLLIILMRYRPQGLIGEYKL